MPDIVTNVLYQEIDRLRARVKELEADRDADRRREYGYSQQTVDALTAERDALKPLIEVAESRRQEILKQDEEIAKLKKRVGELEFVVTEERQRNRVGEAVIRENEKLTKENIELREMTQCHYPNHIDSISSIESQWMKVG